MAQSGYVYLTSQEVEILKNATKTSKSNGFINLVETISKTLEKQASSDNTKYITAAEAKCKKLKFEFAETFIIEDDSNVSVNTDGAYVQAWVWVDNAEIKTKRTTRSRKATS